MFIFNFGFSICLLSIQDIRELQCDYVIVTYMLFSSSHNFFIQHLSCFFFFIATDSAMFSRLESQFAYHLCWQMVHKVCSFYYKCYIFLWVHGWHRSVAKTVIIIFQCGCTVMNGVWMCMRSEHCCGPVSKRDFLFQFDSKATDCPGSYGSEKIRRKGKGVAFLKCF